MSYCHAATITPRNSTLNNWREAMGKKELSHGFPWNNAGTRSARNGKIVTYRRFTGVLATVATVDWASLQQRRAGIIVYSETKTPTGGIRRQFWLGEDVKSSDVTDFGGGVSYKKDGNALNGALRELNEESHNVFGTFSEDAIKKGIVVYNREMIIIFLRKDCLDVPLIDLTSEAEGYTVKSLQEQFQERMTHKSEIKSLISFEESEFKELIETGKWKERVLYSRVRNLLQSVENLFTAFGSN